MQESQEKWSWCDDYAIRSSFKAARKKHAVEYDSCIENLHRLLEFLDAGHKWKTFHFGYLRPEGGDVYRIGQTGVPHAKETRLYVHVDEPSRCIFLLSMGDKDTQSADIATAKQISARIKESLAPNGAADERDKKQSG